MKTWIYINCLLILCLNTHLVIGHGEGIASSGHVHVHEEELLHYSHIFHNLPDDGHDNHISFEHFHPTDFINQTSINLKHLISSISLMLSPIRIHQEIIVQKCINSPFSDLPPPKLIPLFLTFQSFLN